MKKMPLRIVFIVSFILGIIFFIISKNSFVILELGNQDLHSATFVQELHNKKVYLDTSVIVRGDSREGKIEIILLQDDNINGHYISRRDKNTFYVRGNKIKSFYKKYFKTKYDPKAEISLRMEAPDKKIMILPQILDIICEKLQITNKEQIKRLILERTKGKYEKRWTMGYYMYLSIGSILIIISLPSILIFTWKDLFFLGYRRKMKMLSLWHFVFFLPKTEIIIKKHFKKEKERLLEEKKTKIFRDFTQGWKLPPRTPANIIKDKLYHKGEESAKEYCLQKMKAWNFVDERARNFLLENFFDFMKLKEKDRTLIILALTEKEDSWDNTDLESLIKEGVKIEKRSKAVKYSDKVYEIRKKRTEDVPLPPRRMLLAKIDSSLHNIFYELEDMIAELEYDISLAEYFSPDRGKTHLLLLKRLAHIEITNFATERDDKLLIQEIITMIDSLDETDISFLLSILSEIGNKKIRWEKREKYLTVIRDRDWENELITNLFQPTRTIESKIRSAWAGENKKEEVKRSRSIKGKKFLMVHHYYYPQDYVVRLEKAFKEAGAEVTVFQGLLKSRMAVDEIIFLAAYCKHLTTKFYKARYDNWYYVPKLNPEKIVEYVKNGYS